MEYELKSLPNLIEELQKEFNGNERSIFNALYRCCSMGAEKIVLLEWKEIVDVRKDLIAVHYVAYNKETGKLVLGQPRAREHSIVIFDEDYNYVGNKVVTVYFSDDGEKIINVDYHNHK